MNARLEDVLRLLVFPVERRLIELSLLVNSGEKIIADGEEPDIHEAKRQRQRLAFHRLDKTVGGPPCFLDRPARSHDSAALTAKCSAIS